MADPKKPQRASTQLNTRRELEGEGFYLQTPPVSLIMLDPAASGEDGNALVWLDREEWQRGEPWDPDFSTIMICRAKLFAQLESSMEWPQVMSRIYRLHKYMLQREKAGLSFRYFFGVETNGVGYGYAMHLREKLGPSRVLTLSTVAGDKDRVFSEKGIVMPRLAGLDHLRLSIETQRLKVDKDAPGTKDLDTQLRSFVWARPGRPEALEGQRDDLVMALALANWLLTKVLPPVLKAEDKSTGTYGT